MLIEIDQLAKKIRDLEKKRNSLYARVEVLKLRRANKDQNLIEGKQQILVEIESKLSELEKILLNEN